MVAEFQNWSEIFKVEFTITVNMLPDTTTSAFHFSTGENCCSSGGRIPALFIRSDETFHVANSVNGNGNYYQNIPFELGKEHQMTIVQYKDSEEYYWYEIIIDNVSRFKIQNTEPKSFSNVKLYAGHPLSGLPVITSDIGSICNVIVNEEIISGLQNSFFK